MQLFEGDTVVDDRPDITLPEESDDKVEGFLRNAQILGHSPHPVYGVTVMSLRIEVPTG